MLGDGWRSSINCGVVIREAQSIPNPWTSLGLPTSVFLLARSGNRLGRLFLLVCWRSRGPRHCISILYFIGSKTPITKWNFLTSNLIIACALSLGVFVLVCCGASAGLLEIEIMPVPS